jgi:aminomethyltransferase
MTASASSALLSRTPLFAIHNQSGARMVPFAGYDMPVQYPSGVLKEHLHTRSAAGLFDVSHMGQIVVRAKTGRIADAALALEKVVTADVLGLAQGRQRYALFTNPAGGILDDLMIANRGNHFLLVVNAACKVQDEAHLRANLFDSCAISVLDHALIALQGPQAEAVLAELAPACSAMRFMDVRELSILGVPCTASRSGYTGEDGFEISIPASAVEQIARKLLEDPRVALIGLGARDSLRLEAGLCLYGADLDTSTTPVEADLMWSMQASRKPGGARAGGFPGADVILKQVAQGSPRRRIGLKPEGRAPVRAGSALYAGETGGEPIGIVTSGGFGPSVEAPIAMGYVTRPHDVLSSHLFADVRGKRLPVRVVPMPFFPHRYKRT